jgi:HAD superfamily hydrolase (TIGR01509 family)
VGAPAPSPPRRLDSVLFDWDGTLVDSAEVSYRCYRGLFSGLGIPFDRGRFEATYSPNWHRTYTAVGLPEDRWSEADAVWVDLYGREESRLMPGAREALSRLSDRGVALALVTSGERRRVERELTRLGLDACFETAVCGGEVPHRKPHPEALRLALDRMRTPPSRAAYVGDSPEDVEMARAAGVFSVGIPGGFPNGDALRASAPDLLCPSLGAALEVLLPPTSPGGRLGRDGAGGG